MTMLYAISFKGDDVKSNGSIFQMGSHIFFSSGSGISVRVESQLYHQRMRAWIEDRMRCPLVFADESGCRCTLKAPTGGGDVEIELEPARG
jgi:hypothetical protein